MYFSRGLLTKNYIIKIRKNSVSNEKRETYIFLECLNLFLRKFFKKILIINIKVFV